MTIHVIMGFSRPQNRDVLTDWLRGEGIIWHPLHHDDVEFAKEDWIQPKKIVVPPEWANSAPWYKTNEFGDWIDEDYYVGLCDDEIHQRGLYRKIMAMNPTEDVIVISALRGHHQIDKYGIDTLVACPENVTPCRIDLMQYFVKGKHMREQKFVDSQCADGIFVTALKDKGLTFRYEPELYGLYNYLQPGRYDKSILIA